jgi:multiple antibiotic resistance protein
MDVGGWFAQLLKDLVPLLVIVSPQGAVPLFLGMTVNDPPARRHRTAFIAALTTTLTLGAVALAGEALFSFFGISVHAFRIAGGILLFIIGMDLVQVRSSRTRTTEAELQVGVEKEEVGIIPLGIPMLAGPGAIATVMVLAADQHGGPERWGALTALLAAVLLVGLATFLVLRATSHLQRWLNPVAMGIMLRLEGLLLCAIAAQMAVSGVVGAYRAMVPA